MTSQQLIERFRRAAGVLLEGVPRVCRAMGEPPHVLTERTGWRALRERHAVWAARGERPVLVCVIYGPTGAGKSTFFRMLTGCEVPAGGTLRPMSYVGCVAIPAGLDDDEAELATLFPENQLRPLERPDQLRDRQAPAETLYWLRYELDDASGTGGDGAAAGAAHGGAPWAWGGEGEGGAALPPVIADVPDFNSVEHANWDKAARMLDRAEAVLFLAYDEAYKNRDTVEHLEHCCRRAGFLAVVLTKSDPATAREKWDDLLDHVSTADAFAARRHDGQALHAFLATCPVYASPRAATGEQPTLNGVEPLREGDPPLRSLLQGLDQQRILRAALVQPASEAVALARRQLEQAASLQVTLENRLAAVDTGTYAEAEQLATNIFPVGDFLKVFMQEVRQRQGRVQRAITWSVGWMYTLARQGAKLLQRLREREEVQPHRQIEQARLQERADHLFQRLRSTVPEEARQDGLLSEQRFEAIREQFVQQVPPQSGPQWHHTVREEAANWYDTNPMKARVLPTLLDTAAGLGAAGLAIDFFVVGGLGTLTTAGLLATGPTAAGLLGRFLHHWGLEQAFNRTAERWRAQRAHELKEHLLEHLVDPLCAGEWRDQWRQLADAPIDACRRACDELEQLAAEAAADTSRPGGEAQP